MVLDDIKLSVRDQQGRTMALTVHWDDDLDAWGAHLKTLMVFLGFAVDEVVINPQSDDAQRPEE